MAASKQDVDRWIEEARVSGAKYIISVCDTFDYDDYPVYVYKKDELEEKMHYYRNAAMQTINEVIEVPVLESKEEETEETEEEWIKQARDMGAGYILIVTDISHEQHPVFAASYSDMQEQYQYYNSANGESVVRVITVATVKEKVEAPKHGFIGMEKRDHDMFVRHHVCPDREMHDNVPFEATISHSYASAIGSNTYVKCERCGTMQDITDYSEW